MGGPSHDHKGSKGEHPLFFWTESTSLEFPGIRLCVEAAARQRLPSDSRDDFTVWVALGTPPPLFEADGSIPFSPTKAFRFLNALAKAS